MKLSRAPQSLNVDQREERKFVSTDFKHKTIGHSLCDRVGILFIFDLICTRRNLRRRASSLIGIGLFERNTRRSETSRSKWSVDSVLSSDSTVEAQSKKFHLQNSL